MSAGIGSSGSLCRRDSATGGTMSNVSISGSRSRSAWTTSAPNARSPRIAASIVTNARPRRNSGISGIGGICMIRADGGDLVRHGEGPLAPRVHDLAARSHGHHIAPA